MAGIVKETGCCGSVSLVPLGARTVTSLAPAAKSMEATAPAVCTGLLMPADADDWTHLHIKGLPLGAGVARPTDAGGWVHLPILMIIAWWQYMLQPARCVHPTVSVAKCDGSGWQPVGNRNQLGSMAGLPTWVSSTFAYVAQPVHAHCSSYTRGSESNPSLLTSPPTLSAKSCMDRMALHGDLLTDEVGRTQRRTMLTLLMRP